MVQIIVNIMTSLDSREFQRWYSYAEHTLKSARSDHDASFYNWACFKSQQASQFAVKAFLSGIGTPSRGVSVSRLMAKAGFDEETINIAKSLDQCYYPTRYADAWSQGIPEEYYGIKDSSRSMLMAKDILEIVMKKWRLLNGL